MRRTVAPTSRLPATLSLPRGSVRGVIPATLVGRRGLRIRVDIAIGRAERARGLLGAPPLGRREGLLLPRTRSVHTFGLRAPITVVRLRDDLSVIDSVRLPPRRIVFPRRGTTHILELADGADLRTGDRLRLAWNAGSDQRFADEPEQRERHGRQEGDRERGHQPNPGRERDRVATAGIVTEDAENLQDVPHAHAPSSAPRGGS